MYLEDGDGQQSGGSHIADEEEDGLQHPGRNRKRDAESIPVFIPSSNALFFLAVLNNYL